MSIAVEQKVSPSGKLRWAASDVGVVTHRNLLQFTRVPTLLVFSIVQPIMFVLLFRFVFGGAINGLPPGINYVNYLLPGIFVQTAIFGSTQTGIGLATDLKSGLIDRFRSLPMARSAVLAGRTMSDFVRNIVVVLLMIGVGCPPRWQRSCFPRWSASRSRGSRPRSGWRSRTWSRCRPPASSGSSR